MRFLHARLADEVNARVREIIRRPSTARAVAEQVFSDLPDRISSYEPRELPLDVWLLGIAAEAALKRVHDKARDRTPPPAERESKATLRHAFRDAVWGLPPDKRCVLVLRHLVGLSIEQVATRLKKSEGAVRRLDERGRVALRVGLRGLADRSAVA